MTTPAGIYSAPERAIILATTLSAIGRKWVISDELQGEVVEMIAWLETEVEVAIMTYANGQLKRRT